MQNASKALKKPNKITNHILRCIASYLYAVDYGALLTLSSADTSATATASGDINQLLFDVDNDGGGRGRLHSQDLVNSNTDSDYLWIYIGGLVYWIIFGSIVAYSLLTWANQFTHASSVTAYWALQPMTAALLSQLLLLFGVVSDCNTINNNNSTNNASSHCVNSLGVSNLGAIPIVIGLYIVLWDDCKAHNNKRELKKKNGKGKRHLYQYLHHQHQQQQQHHQQTQIRTQRKKKRYEKRSVL